METKLESLTRPEDLRTAAFKFRKNNPSSVSHDCAAMYIELSADRIEQLRQRVQELKKERNSAYKIADHYRAERDELTKELATARLENTIKYGVSHPEMYKSEYEERLEKQRDELLAAAVMAVEMIEYNKHERRHVRRALCDAIASVKEKQNAD